MGQVKMEWERMDGAEQYLALLNAARQVPRWCQSRKDSDGKPAPFVYGEWMRDGGAETWEDACHIVAAGGYCVMERYVTHADDLGKPLNFALCCAVMAAAQKHHHYLHPGQKSRVGQAESLEGLAEVGIIPCTDGGYGEVEVIDMIRRACNSNDDSLLIASRLHGYDYESISAQTGIKAATLRKRMERVRSRALA